MQGLKAVVFGLSFSLGAASVTAHAAANAGPTTSKHMVQVQQIRNATAKINYAGKTFLVDPFLAKKGKYPGFEGTFNSKLRNPLIELPMPVKDILNVPPTLASKWWTLQVKPWGGSHLAWASASRKAR